jgi:hypothetical protein
LLSSAQAYQDMVVALNRGTLNSPRSEGLSLPTGPLFSIAETGTEVRKPTRVTPKPRTFATSSRVGIIGSSSGGVQPTISPDIDPHNVILGDPALPVCVASL